MAKSARIELRIDPDLKARVEALAAERGQTLTVMVERSLEATLAAAGRVFPIPAEQRQERPDPGHVQGRSVTAPAFNRVKTLKR